MLGFNKSKSPVGTSILFRPGGNIFLGNGKGLGISITIQSPIEFHLSLPLGRYRTSLPSKPTKPGG